MIQRLPRLRGVRLLVALVLGLGFLLLGGRILAELYVDVLWYRSVGYSDVFWTRTLWQWGVRAAVILTVALLVAMNLRIASATLGAIRIKRRVGDLEIAEQLPTHFVTWGIVALSLLLGLWFGAAVPDGTGTRILLLFRHESWALTDPFLGRDAAFYLFVLPVVAGVLAFGMVLLLLLAALSTAAYAVTGALQWRGGKLALGELPRVHLASLAALFLVLLAARFWIARHLLVLDGTSPVQGIFGYADHQARLPALQTMAAVAVLAAVSLFWGAWKRRLAPAVAGVVALVLASVLIGSIYPGLIQRFRVEPNELARETPYIESNMAFTRTGFGLDGLQRERWEADHREEVGLEESLEQTSRLAVWNEETLLTHYRELEARFRYYDFAGVAVDRYPAPAGLEPIAVSVREVDPQGIENPSWQNLHLRERFITGMGAVASAVARRTPGLRPPMILSAIPPEFHPGPHAPPGLRLERTTVFFGARDQLYAVLNPDEDTFRAPSGEPGRAGVDYPDGIFLSSLPRTLALAWLFRDPNLLFASEITDSSRFVFRRQVQERVREVAPFLDVPDAPYPVIHEGRIVWVLEGYTTARTFPLSSAYQFRSGRQLSYVRNSVKVTVDAVSGDMRFYVADRDDRLLRVYAAAFPGLFRPLREMPEGLAEHLRYPKPLLTLQAQVLFQYHQETARQFHTQQDVWTAGTELSRGSRAVPYSPEYGIYRLPGEEEPAFLLTTVFVPRGRQNLTGVLAARMDPSRYGELVLYDVPVENQVPGPRQIEALVEQDPEISQQFSLWRTGGSQVWTGHLHLVPVGAGLVYMEPVFLAAEDDAIPELQRYVVSDGRAVVMDRSLDGALALLTGREPEGPADPAAGEVGRTPAGLAGERLLRQALEILDRADERRSAGDWAGYGRAMEELREVLEEAAEEALVPPAEEGEETLDAPGPGETGEETVDAPSPGETGGGPPRP